MAALCGPDCGYCGRCTAAWEYEPDEDEDDEPHCSECCCCLFTDEHAFDCSIGDEEENEDEL